VRFPQFAQWTGPKQCILGSWGLGVGAGAGAGAAARLR
jgi:hypothetical protein